MAKKEQGTVASLSDDGKDKEKDKEKIYQSQEIDNTPVEGDYTASSIDVLEGLEAVRLRPGMYIGTTGPKGLHHLVWEIVDNAVDEALAGHCTQIDVQVNADQSCTVRDNGRGIPTDIVGKTGKSGVETVFTVLHAGGKFGGGGYKVSGGLHGVGASVVNALSSKLDVEVYRDGRVHKQVYLRGQADGDLQILGQTQEKGTKVTFWPDDEIFHDINEDNERLQIIFEWDTLATRLREMAFLNKGLKIILTDARAKVEENEKSETYHYDGGIASYVEYLNDTRDTLHKPPIYFELRAEDVTVECSLCNGQLNIRSRFTALSTISTPTMVAPTKQALEMPSPAFVNDYAKKSSFLKGSRRQIYRGRHTRRA